MHPKFKPPYLGVAYYPEDWDKAEIDFDIAKMKEAGINVARIGEFAWHKMEPHPGCYDFEWLHEVVDKLGAAGIGVVLGTPTATPPRWLTVAHPEVLLLYNDGRVNHGGRRHCCSNQPLYLEASYAITEAMAKEFADDENVIGWQLDNEIYENGIGCLCEKCQERFIRHLRKKFGTIENLNAAWNLNLFSQAYDRFEDIPLPVNAWVNPHHLMEWKMSQNQGHIDFMHAQADILHKYVKVPVGTDTMPKGGFDYRKLNSKLDIIQYNHYNVPENLHETCFWFDALRPLKDVPFWNTETATCWNGSEFTDQSIKPENFCYVNSWLPLVMGAEANMYWLWRTHWAGHELVHGSVLDSSGRPQHIWGEVQKTAADFQKAGDFLNATKVKADIAVHFTSLNYYMWESQPIVADTQYQPRMYTDFYRPLIDLGLRPDIVDYAQPLEGYKVVFSPMMMNLTEKGLSERIRKWVADGGTWIVGPLTDIRNENGTKFANKPFGMLEELIGESWLYGIPDMVGNVTAAWSDGEEFAGNRYYQVFEADSDALVSITGGHSAINGKAIVLKKAYGKGQIIVLGSFPSAKDMQKLYKLALADTGVPTCRTPDGNIMVSPREGNGRRGMMVAEYANKGGRFFLAEPMTDILTGRTFGKGEIELKPYEVLVLEA